MKKEVVFFFAIIAPATFAAFEFPLRRSETSRSFDTPVKSIGFAKLKELATDLSQAATYSTTPMQRYFEKHVITKGANVIQQTADKMKRVLDEKTSEAKRALNAIGSMQDRLAEKAADKLKQAESMANSLIKDMEYQSNEFFNKAIEQVVGVRLQTIQPVLNEIQQLSGRVVKAIAPLANVRLNRQIEQLSGKVVEFSTKASRLAGQWQEALRQLAERSAWSYSHIRPVALGGKTTQQISTQASQQYPLAKTADELWNFYPQVIRSINDLRLGGPGIIIQNFLQLIGKLLNAFQGLNRTVGKIGKVLVPATLAQALGNLQLQLEFLATQIRQVTSVTPILKEFPQSTSSALIEAAKGFTWRVGPSLTNQIMNKINNMSSIYDKKINPAIDSINAKQAQLIEIFNATPITIKKEFVSKLKSQPIINALRGPLILAQSLGSAISIIKGQINHITKSAIEAISGVNQLLTEAPSLADLINNAVGGELVNKAIIEGIRAISTTSQHIASAIQQLNQAIQGASIVGAE